MKLHPHLTLALGVLLNAPGPVLAQQFVQNESTIPQGHPINTGETENIDFGDVDLDGDWDAAFANGGDSGNQQNRLWLNRGPLFPGTFTDVTNLRFPLQPDASRDIEFVDFDGDGDPDIYIANDAQLVNQSCRWWNNTGIASGAFVDETATRWVDIGDNDGLTSFSSISAQLVLPAGGFIDWVADGDFADLDNDGDLDLFHASYGSSYSGNTPSRIFFNDGLGHFSEHNPSGFQLPSSTLPAASPALWAEGLHLDDTQATDGSQADITSNGNDSDLMDIDGDLDIDIAFGNQNWPSRLFVNRLEEDGSALFRDETFARLAEVAVGGLGYEQELGDVDGDGDLDLYGVNWSGFNDTLQLNDGTGNFGLFALVPGSGADDNEADFLDYDSDGDLDVFVASWFGADRLYENDGAGGLTLTAGVIPATSPGISHDADVSDVDGDGDYDIFIAEAPNMPNRFLENAGPAVDTTAPSLFRLEQAPDRTPGLEPSVVRVQVYDNAPYYLTWRADVTLEYALDGGPFTPVAMQSSGAQIFRGELPGTLEGQVCYRAFAVDEHGNQSATTPELCFLAGEFPTIYCTPKLSSSACVNPISTNLPLAQPTSGASDYSVTCASVQGFKNGLLFAGIAGPTAAPFSGGTLCVTPPLKRGPIQNSGGSSPTDCSGSFAQLVNDGAVVPLGLDAGAGNSGWYQWWYRDPANGVGTLGTALSDALQLDFE